MCFRGGGTHITRDICFPDGGSHITRNICVFQVGWSCDWLMPAPLPTLPAKPRKSALETRLLHYPSLCAKPLSSLLLRIWSLFYSFHQYSIPSVSFFLLCHTPVFPLTLHVFFFFYYFHQLQHSHLYLPSLCATSYHALYFVFFILITLITSYTLYVSPLLCALLYRHFPLSFPFSLLGPLLLCFFFCSKHQGRVVQSRVKMTQG